MSLPKLVRDKIPEIIQESGRKCEFRVASKDELKELLFAKMQEEIREFIEEPSTMEAADIYEVFISILSQWDIDFSDVVNHAYYKREEKGSFRRSLVLEKIIN